MKFFGIVTLLIAAVSGNCEQNCKDKFSKVKTQFNCYKNYKIKQKIIATFSATIMAVQTPNVTKNAKTITTNVPAFAKNVQLKQQFFIIT